jgi:hypothetical protein
MLLIFVCDFLSKGGDCMFGSKVKNGWSYSGLRNLSAQREQFSKFGAHSWINPSKNWPR